MLSILALALAPVTFPGGSPAELARSVSEAAKAPVVIEAGAAERYGAFDFDVASLDEMAKAVAKATKLRRAPGADHVFFGPTLPAWNFELAAIRATMNDGSRGTPGGALSESALKNGLVTLQCKPRTGYSLGYIEGWSFSKPLAVSPCLQRLAIAGWLADVPERDFLNLLAKAAGGTLVSTKEKWSIEPNGAELQRRALATLDEAKKADSFKMVSKSDKAELEVSRAAVSSCPPQAFAALLATGTPFRFEIGPSVRSAAAQWIQSLMETPAQPALTFGPPNPPVRAQPQPNPGAEKFRSLDRRLIGIATLSPGMRVTLELATVNEYGRPGPPLRVP